MPDLPSREPADLDARLDELRRRVYGPDASDEDRREYAALLQPPDEPEHEPEHERRDAAPPSPASARPRRGLPILIGASGLVLVVGLGVTSAITARDDAPTTEATTSTTSIWSGSADPTAAPLPTPATLSLQRGTVRAQATSGGGSAVIPLLLDGAPRFGGTLVVSVSSSDPAPVGWIAQRHRGVANDTGGLERVAASPPALRQGAASPTVVSYTGAPPTQITVRAPVGTGWSITVAFTG